jgi:predicted permease
MNLWPLTLRRVLRRLAAQPGFSLSAALLLGLGLAATSGFLVLVRTVLLDPLPYEEPDALYGLRSRNDREGTTTATVSVADFADLRRTQTSFSALAAYRGDFVSYTPPGGSTRQWFGARVTAGFFEVLGQPPVRGRRFAPEDFRPGAPAVAILSEQAWEQHFAREETLVGRNLALNGVPTTIIGVMPRAGREPAFADVWLPFPDRSPEYMLRDARYWSAIVRLAPEASPAAARAELRNFSARLAESYPQTNRHWTLELEPLLEMRVGGVRQTLLLGSFTAALLLVVTGLNLANLLLARGTRRQGDYAVQRALGARGTQLMGEALLESLLLAAAGGLLAAGLLLLGFNLILPRFSTELLPRHNEIRFGLRESLPLLLITTLTGALSGLWPAFQARRPNLLRLLNLAGAGIPRTPSPSACGTAFSSCRSPSR